MSEASERLNSKINAPHMTSASEVMVERADVARVLEEREALIEACKAALDLGVETPAVKILERAIAKAEGKGP